MYTKEEASKLKEAFWTAFGKYLAPVPSAEGLKINWVNYKTGIRNIKFFMDGDTKKASVGIKLFHDDPDIQELVFEEFVKLKPQIEEYLQDEWSWILHVTDGNEKFISRIYKELPGVNLFNQDDWPAIISFLKPRIIALDAFWCDWKYNFEGLV